MINGKGEKQRGREVKTMKEVKKEKGREKKKQTKKGGLFFGLTGLVGQMV